MWKKCGAIFTTDQQVKLHVRNDHLGWVQVGNCKTSFTIYDFHVCRCTSSWQADSLYRLNSINLVPRIPPRLSFFNFNCPFREPAFVHITNFSFATNCDDCEDWCNRCTNNKRSNRPAASHSMLIRSFQFQWFSELGKHFTRTEGHFCHKNASDFFL